MTEKNPEGQDFIHSLVTSGRTFKIAVGQPQAGDCQIEWVKAPIGKDVGGRGLGGLPPLWRRGRLAASRAYLPAKDSAAFAAKAFEFFGMESITFISCQSYGNSLPQPRQATYVPVSCAAGESLWPGRLVIGKLKFL
jgi:hypothetical protein